MMSSERYITGQGMLQRVGGRGEEAAVGSLQNTAPDFVRYLIEFPFGDIYTRPGLGLRSREIATIAALIVLSDAAPRLKVHIAAGLNVDLTQEEITKVIVQTAVYAGFPAILSGLFTTKAAFATH